jgi:hypothetical protein
MRVETLPSLSVDKSRKDQMKINLNMTFPHIPCFMLSIDVMDVSGAHQNGVDHQMHKSRIDKNGNMLTKEEISLGENQRDATKKTQAKDYCGSCYGATAPQNGCCNTCDEVRNAYRTTGWTLDDSDKFEQVFYAN